MYPRQASTKAGRAASGWALHSFHIGRIEPRPPCPVFVLRRMSVSFTLPNQPAIRVPVEETGLRAGSFFRDAPCQDAEFGFAPVLHELPRGFVNGVPKRPNQTAACASVFACVNPDRHVSVIVGGRQVDAHADFHCYRFFFVGVGSPPWLFVCLLQSGQQIRLQTKTTRPWPTPLVRAIRYAARLGLGSDNSPGPARHGQHAAHPAHDVSCNLDAGAQGCQRKESGSTCRDPASAGSDSDG